MADIKISELTAVSSLNNGDLVEVSQVNALAPSGYTSLKASMTDLGKKVNSDIEYTTDLADFTDKTTLGAIKETAKGKNVADEYDDTQTYDKGDVVIYKNTLYICNTNNTTGAWDASKWTATTIDNIIGDLSQLTTTDKYSLVGAVNEVNAKATSKELTLSVEQGVNFAYSSVSYNDKLVTITAEVRFTGGANSWTNLATISKPPKVVQLSTPAVNSANGSLMGILQVQSSGNIRIYPTTAQNNGACAFSISYLTT